MYNSSKCKSNLQLMLITIGQKLLSMSQFPKLIMNGFIKSLIVINEII